MTHGPGFSAPLPGPLPAIDVEAGVERLMGNRQIYLRALARFLHDYRHAGGAIRAALDGGDLARAQHLAHTLKGAAGMIEAGALYASALALEGALRGGERHVEALFLHADEALSRVLRELDAMALPAEDLARPATPAAPHPRARLRAMLDIGDGAAVEHVEAARAELRAELGEREYEAVRAAVTMFDYERALELLNRFDAAGE